MRPGGWLRFVALLWLGLFGCSFCSLPYRVETGTHWVPLSDFATLQKLGYQFVIGVVSNDRSEWSRTFDAAEAAGLRLIIGLNPSPYRMEGNAWTISPVGVEFLRYARSRPELAKAIFVFNEPYWVNPFTGATDLCGALSALQLRNLRTTIRQVWPEARIYHDIGAPSTWAPFGQHRRDHACVGDKYADATGIADFVGVWFYPFERSVHRRAEGLTALGREIAYVRTSMNAEPIVLGQVFHCPACDGSPRMPTAGELRDWNCATRSLSPHGISWYVWRQELYQDYLARRPDYWDATTASACLVP